MTTWQNSGIKLLTLWFIDREGSGFTCSQLCEDEERCEIIYQVHSITGLKEESHLVHNRDAPPFPPNPYDSHTIEITHIPPIQYATVTTWRNEAQISHPAPLSRTWESIGLASIIVWSGMNKATGLLLPEFLSYFSPVVVFFDCLWLNINVLLMSRRVSECEALQSFPLNTKSIQKMFFL